MIHNGIVTVEYTSSVRSLFQCFQHMRRVSRIRHCIDQTIFNSLGVFQIKPRRIKGAFIPVGTSVQTIGSRSFWCIFLFEIGQFTKRTDAFTSAFCQPQHNIHIVAAFLQNHRAGLFWISPIASYKAVCVMPVSYLFHVLNSHQSANSALLQQFF